MFWFPVLLQLHCFIEMASNSWLMNTNQLIASQVDNHGDKPSRKLMTHFWHNFYINLQGEIKITLVLGILNQLILVLFIFYKLVIMSSNRVPPTPYCIFVLSSWFPTAFLSISCRFSQICWCMQKCRWLWNIATKQSETYQRLCKMDDGREGERNEITETQIIIFS